jgi:hypothetical protein
MIRYAYCILVVLCAAVQVLFVTDAGKALLAQHVGQMSTYEAIILPTLLLTGAIQLLMLRLIFLADRQDLHDKARRQRGLVRGALQKLWSINPAHREEAQATLSQEYKARREFIDLVRWSYVPAYALASLSFVALAIFAVVAL